MRQEGCHWGRHCEGAEAPEAIHKTSQKTWIATRPLAARDDGLLRFFSKASVRQLSCGFFLIFLSACSSSEKDLQEFVKNSEKGMVRKIDPLPPIQPFESFSYEGFDLPDPLKPRKLSFKADGGGGLQPDFSRPKEPLEAYPLEQLKMVGIIKKDTQIYALIRADKTLYRVSKGNYLGQNFGLITDVSEGEIKLKEIIQDTAGDWTERDVVMPLLEEAESKGGAKK